MSWIGRYWYVIAFVLVNSAVAAPVAADLDNDWCSDGNGGAYECCTHCFFFCNCSWML